MTVSPPKGFVSTSSPGIFCTKLPPHWRRNKSLPVPFTVLLPSCIPDRTIVTVKVGNTVNPKGGVRNGAALLINKKATFRDLRFIGSSGRGRSFDLKIHCEDQLVATVKDAIKVSADGPRGPRPREYRPLLSSAIMTPPVTPPGMRLRRPTRSFAPLRMEPPRGHPYPTVPIPFMQLFPLFPMSPSLPYPLTPRDSPECQSITGPSLDSRASVIVRNPCYN